MSLVEWLICCGNVQSQQLHSANAADTLLAVYDRLIVLSNYYVFFKKQGKKPRELKLIAASLVLVTSQPSLVKKPSDQIYPS